MNQNKLGSITLKILVPEGYLPELTCDTVEFTVSDNNKGKGGGRYTVKKGHCKSIMMLSNGDVIAKMDSKVILSKHIDSGIAEIKSDNVLIMTSSITI